MYGNPACYQLLGYTRSQALRRFGRDVEATGVYPQLRVGKGDGTGVPIGIAGFRSSAPQATAGAGAYSIPVVT